MDSKYNRKLDAFYKEFLGGSSEVNRSEARKKLSRFPFCLNKMESNAFLNESIKEKVLNQNGFKLVFKRR